MKRILILSLFLIAALTINSYAQIAVIVNKDVNVSSIDKTELKNIFSIDAKRLGGSAVTLFDNADAGASSKFYS